MAKGPALCPFSSISLNMGSTDTCGKVNVNWTVCLDVDEYRWLSHVPSAPRCDPARGQEAGPQCPDVPLPAQEAADALPGEVSHPPSPDTLIFLGHVCLSPDLRPSLPSLPRGVCVILWIFYDYVCLCVWPLQTQGRAKSSWLRSVNRWGERGRRFHSVWVSWVGTCE